MGLLGCDYLESTGSFLPEYRCKYSRQILDSRTAQNICMSSRYTDCADYKEATGCFITSAVCLTLGKPDDCEELTILRNLRDHWLRKQPDGPALIEEYYQIAPGIVQKINQQPDCRSVYASIYQKFIQPCVNLAKAGDFTQSKRVYVDMVNLLKEQYG